MIGQTDSIASYKASLLKGISTKSHQISACAAEHDDGKRSAREDRIAGGGGGRGGEEIFFSILKMGVYPPSAISTSTALAIQVAIVLRK